MNEASERKECACKTCQSGCTHKPGWFMPEQIPQLASAMGLSEQELFDKHLMVDWFEVVPDEPGGIYVIAPAIVEKNPDDPRHKEYAELGCGTCTFYDTVTGKCGVHNLGKPLECAEAMICEEHARILETGSPWKDSNTPRVHEQIGHAWGTPQHQAYVEKLLGRKPVVTMMDFMFHNIYQFLRRFDMMEEDGDGEETGQEA